MQSLACFAVGGVLLAAAALRSVSRRAGLAASALAVLLGLAWWLPIPDDLFMMGDGTSLVHNRDNFAGVVLDDGVVRFSAHLAYWLLGRFDTFFGSTADSSLRAYRLLSWLALLVSVIGLGGLAAVEGWSARAVRYCGLVVLAPAMLMYFGYLEVGYLSLSAAAFPLAARDLSRAGHLTAGLLAAALLAGVGAAMHGIGYLGIAGLVVAVLASRWPGERRLVMAIALGAIACGAALIWLWFYLAVLGLDVVPGHATSGFIVRPLWQPRQAEGRLVQPLLSWVTGRDLIVSGCIAGLPTLAPACWNGARSSLESRLALIYTLPCVLAFVLFWPVQGVAVEVDMIVAAFPAVFALLWVCAQSGGATAAGAAVLALGHAAFWWVVRDHRFVNDMLR